MGKDLNGKEIGKCMTQRANGTYEARYVDRYGVRKSLYAATIPELKLKLDKAKYEDSHHQEVMSSITLDKWFEVWLDVYKTNAIRPSTRVGYLNVYNHHISPHIGNFLLCEIKTIDIRRLINILEREGFGYSTQNRVRIMLSDMFDKAIMDDYMIKNPARGVKVTNKEDFTRRVLTKDEQNIFFELSKGTFFDNLYVVMITTGMRIGEVCALTWDDIDLENKRIKVTKTLSYQKFEGDTNRSFHIGPPKTRTSNREIPISKRCEIALKKQFVLRNNIMSRKYIKPVKGFENLLFVSIYGRPVCTQTVTDAMDKLVREINETRDDAEQMLRITPHCFRHTFATRCFEAGIPPKTVQTLLGHASLDMTMNLYTHVMDDKKDEALEALNEYYEQIDEDEKSVDESFKRAVNDCKKIVYMR